MPVLVAGIHVLSAGQDKNVDGRNKSGHDARVFLSRLITALMDGRIQDLELDWLVAKKYLPEKQRKNKAAIKHAIESLLSDEAKADAMSR
jgi:hypothetical protein